MTSLWKQSREDLVDFSNIVRHSPSHGQWENPGPLSWIRVDLVKDQIDLDMVQIDLIEDQVNPSLLDKPR